MTFGSGVLDQYHVSADTSKNWLDVGYCKVIPNNVASIQKNWRHKSHRVIVVSDDHILDNSGYVHKEWFLGQFGNRQDTMWTMIGEIEPYLINPEWSCSHRTGSGMLHICFGLAMATLPQVRENDNAIPFQKRGRSAERTVHIWNWAFQKAIPVIIVPKMVPDYLDQLWTEGLSVIVFRALR